MKVAIEQYNANWSTQFERVAADLLSLFHSLPDVRIEHVGSTSVTGLAAKPIIDIDIIVEPNQIRSAVELMEAAGYRSLGDQGIEGRVALDAPDETPPRHVYICRSDSLALKNHLAIRETLRASDRLRDEYSALKHALSQRDFNNMDEYVFAKTQLLQKILAQSGLSENELAEVEAANS